MYIYSFIYIFIGDFPIETPMKLVDFQLPGLMKPEGIATAPRQESIYETSPDTTSPTLKVFSGDF